MTRKTEKAKTEKLTRSELTERITAGVAPDLKAQAVTLADAVLAMQDKIETSIPEYKAMPLSQTVTVGTGETILRANPAAQEFRATVRDYAQALKSLNEILASGKPTTSASSVDDLRARFKVG